jgi:hypothetical protein
MSFKALKARQSDAWGSAPWEPMAERFAAIHDHLVARSLLAAVSAGSTSARAPARSRCARRAREHAWRGSICHR